MKRLFLTVLFLVIFFHPSLAEAGGRKEVKKGNLLYNKGEFKKALKEYNLALSDNPDSDIVNFNLGGAYYKTGDYAEAIGCFRKSLVTDDKSLEQKASYNIGNSEYKFGISREDSNLKQAVNLLKEALRHYKRAIELDDRDEDAEYNYKFVKKELERLEEKIKQDKKEESEEKKEQEKEERKTDAEKKEQKKEGEKAGSEKQAEKQKNEGEEAGEAPKEEEKEENSTQVKEEDGKRKGFSAGKDAEKKEGEMSEKEARMILDAYRQEEEPKGLYRGKIPSSGEKEILKDW